WSRRATFIAVGTLLAVLCTVFLLKALISQFRRVVDSERSLAEREGRLAEKSLELAKANEQLDAALNNMSQGLCMFDQKGRLVVCNNRFLQMFGLSAEIVGPGCTAREILEHRHATGSFSGDVGQYLDEMSVCLAQGKSFSTTVDSTDGRVITSINLPIPGSGWVGTHEDVTERHRVEAQIAHMACHDALTGLGNRVLFQENMDEALAKVAQS